MNIPTFKEFYKVFIKHEYQEEYWYYLDFKIRYIKPAACYSIECKEDNFAPNNEFEMYGNIISILENRNL